MRLDTGDFSLRTKTSFICWIALIDRKPDDAMHKTPSAVKLDLPGGLFGGCGCQVRVSGTRQNARISFVELV